MKIGIEEQREQKMKEGKWKIEVRRNREVDNIIVFPYYDAMYVQRTDKTRQINCRDALFSCKKIFKREFDRTS